MGSIRQLISAFGVVPLALLLLGLLWGSKYSKALMIVGVVYGLANVLFSVRQVNATVEAGEASITYQGAHL